MVLVGRSRVAQWIACWAHNPEVRGSKPRSALQKVFLPLTLSSSSSEKASSRFLFWPCASNTVSMSGSKTQASLESWKKSWRKGVVEKIQKQDSHTQTRHSIFSKNFLFFTKTISHGSFWKAPARNYDLSERFGVFARKSPCNVLLWQTCSDSFFLEHATAGDPSDNICHMVQTCIRCGPGPTHPSLCHRPLFPLAIVA